MQSMQQAAKANENKEIRTKSQMSVKNVKQLATWSVVPTMLLL